MRAGSVIVDAIIHLPADPEPEVVEEIMELQQTPANEVLFEIEHGDDGMVPLTTKEKITVDFVTPVCFLLYKEVS